jgi:hypothetical protein
MPGKGQLHVTCNTRISSSPRKPLIPRKSNAATIDPGYGAKSGGCAVAEGRGGFLVGVGFVRKLDDYEFGDLDHVIAEQPQQDGRSDGVPPVVLIRLSWAGAKLAGYLAGAHSAELHEPTPREWKGSEAKPNMHERLWAILTPAEREILGGDETARQIEAACERGALCRWSKPGAELYPSTFTTHNLLDAAAILMWAYGRLEKVG